MTPELLKTLCNISSYRYIVTYNTIDGNLSDNLRHLNLISHKNKDTCFVSKLPLQCTYLHSHTLTNRS